MQIFNPDQQYISARDRANEQEKQTFALEKAQDEIELLREQVTSLQQYLYEQMRQQQAVEQELHKTNQELKQINIENQQLIQEKLALVREMAGFAQALLWDGRPNKRALMKLFSNLGNDIALIEESEPIEIHSDSVAAAFRPNRTSKSGLQTKDLRKAI